MNMTTNNHKHRRTRYERVKQLRDQAVEDGQTDKMWQATYLLKRLEEAAWARINKRNELINLLRS